MKIQLIRPPIDDWFKATQLVEYTNISNTLAMLGTALRGISEVEIIDLQNKPSGNPSIESIINKLDADIVGVTTLYATQLNTLKILKAAYKKGATTFVGGATPRFLGRNMLKNRDYINFVVTGDGLNVLPDYISGKNISEIPNIMWRNGDKIIKNPSKKDPINFIFDLKDYNKELINPNLPIVTRTIKGCYKVIKSGKRCDHCAIRETYEEQSHETAWKQKEIFLEHGIKDTWESSDTFIVQKYLEDHLNSRPNHLKKTGYTMVYSSPEEITPEIVKLLKNLNVKRVFIGVESYNDEIIKNAGRHYTTKDIDEAIRLVTNAGINVHIPSLFGLKGETNKTIQNTYENAKKIATKFPETIIVASIVNPLPGNNYFRKLSEIYPSLKTADVFDYNQLARLQIKHFTNTDFETCKKARDATAALIKREGYKTSFYS